MDPDQLDSRPPTDRESPVGAPVIRGDETVLGERAREAVEFDPTDPDSLERAAETVQSFAAGTGEDHIVMLEGAAACAALVRGVGSYTEAANRAGGETTVSFIRKWARVHDLPRAIRKQVALGVIAPSAAKHIARVDGDARYHLAWATIDNDLTVREVRSIASEINSDGEIVPALVNHDVAPGKLSIDLPLPVYRELRRVSSLQDIPPGEVVAESLLEWFETQRS